MLSKIWDWDPEKTYSGSRSATLIASMRITKQVSTFYHCGGPINFCTDPGYFIGIQLKSVEISRQNCT
jgi:hypothetical protein